MSDTQNEQPQEKSWKKTTSIVCIGLGGLLIAAGNLFAGDLSLSDGVVQMINAVGAILGAFGIGTYANKSQTTEK